VHAERSADDRWLTIDDRSADIARRVGVGRHFRPQPPIGAELRPVVACDLPLDPAADRDAESRTRLEYGKAVNRGALAAATV
jgi:hypothetical protein